MKLPNRLLRLNFTFLSFRRRVKSFNTTTVPHLVVAPLPQLEGSPPCLRQSAPRSIVLPRQAPGLSGSSPTPLRNAAAVNDCQTGAFRARCICIGAKHSLFPAWSSPRLKCQVGFYGVVSNRECKCVFISPRPPLCRKPESRWFPMHCLDSFDHWQHTAMRGTFRGSSTCHIFQ